MALTLKLQNLIPLLISISLVLGGCLGFTLTTDTTNPKIALALTILNLSALIAFGYITHITVNELGKYKKINVDKGDNL